MRKLKPGERFGHWTVVTRSTKLYGGSKSPSAICVCDCGNQSNISAHSLLSGNSTQCVECQRASYTKIVEGHTFGSKTVISRNGDRVVFECSCGMQSECKTTSFHRSFKCRHCTMNRTGMAPKSIIAVGEREFTAKQCAEILGCTTQWIYQIEKEKLEERMVEAICQDNES